MGKILISEDKRTVWYLSACAALFAASAYFVATRLDDALLRVKISIGSIGCFAIMAAAIVAIYLIVLSRMILIIKFIGSGIKYGFCAKREIQYSEICRVDTKDGLEIHLKAKTRRIRVIDLSLNKENGSGTRCFLYLYVCCWRRWTMHYL